MTLRDESFHIWRIISGQSLDHFFLWMELEDEEGLSALGKGQQIIDVVEILDDDDDDDCIEVLYQPPPTGADKPKIKEERVESPPLELPQSPFENEQEHTSNHPLEEEQTPDTPLKEEQVPQEEQLCFPPEDEQPAEEEHLPEEVPPVVIKKKRGKKKKPVVEEVFIPLPEEALTGFSPDIVEELQTAYKILQTILRISMIQPFLDKPNENLFGMSSYYSIIKKPMWLNEVQRKLFNQEYNGIGSFVADIRLILENCYRFWGPTHKFSRKALFIEHKLELKLVSLLPESMREKCLEPELKANEVVYQNERGENIEVDYSDENSQDQKTLDTPRESVTTTLIKGFESKILNRVLESNDGYDNEDIEEQNKKEEEMLAWEREHLVSEEDRQLIKSMWQLAEIGSFLKLTCVALNVEEITQYEVERMLLMPKESTTLATLMTSMLSPHVLRSQLDFKAVMPYEIWTDRLKKRIDHWFHVFYSCGEFQAFVECGIEPAFWSFINITNPLDNNISFYEIPFIQRVWIFKSLCNNLMHTDKPIQDCFFNTNIRDLRPICIGRDKKRNIYFRIPFFQEIRVYKQACLPENTLNAVHGGDFHDEFLSELLDSTNDVTYNEDDQALEFTPSSKDCCMIADSFDSLSAYTKQLKDKKQFGLAKSFSNQLKLVKNERKSIDGLIALHTQWHEYQVRSQEYFSHILTLWVNTEKRKQHTTDYFNSGHDEDKNVEVLGKRRSKRNQKADFLCFRGSDESDGFSSSDYESSDISDWETTYRNKKKKKTETKKKRKQASSESNGSDMEEQCNEESNSTLSILGVHSMQDDMFEIEEKPNINEINIKIENGNNDSENLTVNNSNDLQTSFGISNSLSEKPQVVSKNVTVPSTGPSSYSLAPVIKKEKDDVICISSDEEEEKKVSGKGLVRNGIPPVVQAVPAPPRRTSVSTPISNVPGHLSSVPPLIPSIPVPMPNVPTPSPSVPVPIPLQPVPQPIPVPAPIPVQTVPQPIPATPPKPRRMPLPIPEPPWPQPMVEPAMPQPISAPRPPGWPQASPRTPTSTPRARMVSPRMRSPLSTPAIRTPSPRPSPLRSPALSPVRQPLRNTAVRNLFPQTSPAVHTVEGVLEIGQKPDGSYGYHVRLPDGGIINMNRQEIDDIRRKNNGVLPVKLEVPLTKNKKF